MGGMSTGKGTIRPSHNGEIHIVGFRFLSLGRLPVLRRRYVHVVPGFVVDDNAARLQTTENVSIHSLSINGFRAIMR